MIRTLRPSPAVALFALATLAGLVAVATADVTGDQVKRAVRRGVTALRSLQQDDGSWTEHNYPGGMTCLATLALLQAGDSPDSPPITSAVRRIVRIPDNYTYVVGLKLMVLTRVDPQRYRPQIIRSARWLVDAQNNTGLWRYTQNARDFDHSNSQFALLGLHAAAQAGIEIPDNTWRRAERAVIASQNTDGGWTYQRNGPSYGSMTAAAVADLLILGHRLEHGQERGFRNGAAPRCGQYRSSKPLSRGLDWLARHFRPDLNPPLDSEWTYYWLYAVERCAMLSGQRYFGHHDWYRAGAQQLVLRQGRDGLWTHDLHNTCFALLFLAKGHRALLLQKLKWSDDDAWTPDRYDADHLVSYLGGSLGQPVTWQVVPFDAPLEHWLAAPLLYFHGHDFPDWNDQQRTKLRRYVEEGGTIFAEACCSRDEFRTGFIKFAAETFPEAPLRELGEDHALYRVVHEVPEYGLMGIDLGCRTSVIFSPRDLSCLWEQADIPNLSTRAFQLGANIAAYAVGRRPLRDRLDAVVLPAQTAAPAGPPLQDAFRLTQVVYDGDWRPFPLALVHLAEFLREELSFDVITQYQQMRLTDEKLYTAPVLYLAGHYDFTLSAPERQALSRHLRRGGFLIADACCGTEPFDTAFRRLIKQTFPNATLERLPVDHPIFAGSPGFDTRQVAYSEDIQKKHPDLNTPELWGLRLDGRLAIVYSPYSLGCGLSGPTFPGCWGLTTPDARRLAANIILYALTH